MTDPTSPLEVVAQAIARIVPRSRIVPLVSSDVTWSSRTNPHAESVAALEEYRLEIASVVARGPSRGIVVDVAGLARVTVGTSGKFTGVVVLLALEGFSSRVVILPVE